MRACTEADFLKDVSTHKMTVLLDNGLHRYIKFTKPDKSYYMHFTLTTWPGYLCISGDMGCFVFSRLPDMFEFFRTDRDINPQYWAEKCVAENEHGNGVMEYDQEVFRERVKDWFDGHEFENRATKRECWKQIKEQVLIADHEYEAHDLARRFRFFANSDDEFKRGAQPDFEFSDFWEARLRLKSYTYQYLWCCYAIKWGIQQYDAVHKMDKGA
jgi:hypothetical protein